MNALSAQIADLHEPIALDDINQFADGVDTGTLQCIPGADGQLHFIYAGLTGFVAVSNLHVNVGTIKDVQSSSDAEVLFSFEKERE